MRRALLILLVAACGKGDKPQPPPTPTPTPTPTPPASNVKATAAFVDVTVVPMDSEHELAHQTVLVDGDKVVAVGPVASTGVPAGAAKIDGAGKWLVPGLVDMHVHFNDERDGILYLANGVTTVRNMWGSPMQLEWRDKVRKHDPSFVGPAICTAGPIVDGDPPVWPGSKVIHDAKEAEAEVTAEKTAGYDFIKVYDGIPLVAYDALAAAAKKQGMRFAGHMVAAVSLEHAFASGQASIEHLTGYLQEAQDATSKAATIKGPARRAELAKHRDLSKIPALAKLTADAKVANCPTLVVLDRISHLDHPEAMQARPELKHVAPAQLASWDPKQDFRFKSATPEMFQMMRDGAEFRNKLVKALSDDGAPILAGTDTSNPFVVAGFALHDELALLVGAGLTPYQALRAATAAAGDWLGDAGIGRIAVGSHADLVLLDADPLKDITATTKRSGVMVRGTWMSKADLDAKLDAHAASLTGKADRFATAPALDQPAGDVVLAATYQLRFNGNAVGSERFAVVKTKDGGRTIVAQSAGDPPLPRFATMKLQLDAAGNVKSYALDEDGKKVTAAASGGKLHIAAAKMSEIAFPADGLVDGSFISLMSPFIAHAKPGAKTTLVAKQLDGSGGITDVTYTFDRTATPIKVTQTSSGATGEGTLEIDDNGLPKHFEIKFPFGTIDVTRQ